MLVAEIRDGDVVGEMAPQDGDLLDGRIVLSRLPQWEKLLPSSTITRTWHFSISG
jgi:hypothetical protein